MLLKPAQVAARLNCSLSTVYSLVAQKKLAGFRIGPLGAGVRISEEDLQRYLASVRTDAEEPLNVPPRGPGRPFTHLDGDRLRAAWKQRGVDAG